MKINILDNQTIDKIAAGEVVERPASEVKELVENAIDSGADAVTVEIKDGGISLIRVTDNGSGIERSQIRNAFLRHATSKIVSADDLTELVSLGFRGEALASIAAVSMVEAISKVEEDLTGVRYVIEGGVEKEFQEVGVPNGTTMIVRNLFYNTLPRKKFLKQPQTEGSYVVDLMEHLTLSHPQIAFNFIINNQNRFHTSGNNDLKEIIYRIYGKDIVKELNEIHIEREGFSIDGFLGKPVINRSNRNYELFYINGRYIKSSLLSKAVEDGYKEYLMQHKFPFCVLHFNIDTKRIDVNVHPAKMEVKIAGEQEFYELVRDIIFGFLHGQEMIPEVTFENNGAKNVSTKNEAKIPKAPAAPEPFETARIEKEKSKAGINTVDALNAGIVHEPVNYMNKDSVRTASVQPIQKANERVDISKKEHMSVSAFKSENPQTDTSASMTEPAKASSSATMFEQTKASSSDAMAEQTKAPASISKPEQLELFDDKLLSAKAREHYEIIGQVFDTYWLVSYQDKLMIIDQHAAHEKVKYERLIKQFNEKNIVSQSLNPPAVITLNGREKACLIQNMEHFEALGFVIEEFGGNDYALVSVPMDLYGYRETELLYELLDELSDENVSGTPESIRIKIATMACKAAVKGNMRISKAEMEALIDELLSLDNPYNCPHGRPTIISMSKYELEKKFNRIVTI